MAVTYYIKLFRTGADGHNDILMYLLLLVAETIKYLPVRLMFNDYKHFLSVFYSLSWFSRYLIIVKMRQILAISLTRVLEFKRFFFQDLKIDTPVS